MIVVVRAVLVDSAALRRRRRAGLDLHRQPALSLPPLGRRLPRARGRSSGVQRRRGLSDACRSPSPTATLAERVTARAVTGSYFPLLGQTPQLGRLFDASDDARDDRVGVLTHALLGAALRQRSVGARPGDDHRRRPSTRSSACCSATSGPLEHDVALFTAGALADADAQGPVLHDGAGPAAPRRVGARRRSTRCAPTNAPALSDLAVVVPGREGDVGPAGPEGARRRRRRLDARLRAGGGRLRAAHRLRQRRQPADRARLQREPRAGDSRRARRVDAAGCCSTCWSKTRVLTAGAALVGLGVAALVAAAGRASTAATTFRASTRCASRPTTLAWLAGLAVASGVVIGLVPAWHGARLRVDRALRAGGRSSTDGAGAAARAARAGRRRVRAGHAAPRRRRRWCWPASIA